MANRIYPVAASEIKTWLPISGVSSRYEPVAKRAAGVLAAASVGTSGERGRAGPGCRMRSVRRSLALAGSVPRPVAGLPRFKSGWNVHGSDSAPSSYAFVNRCFPRRVRGGATQTGWIVLGSTPSRGVRQDVADRRACPPAVRLRRRLEGLANPDPAERGSAWMLIVAGWLSSGSCTNLFEAIDDDWIRSAATPSATSRSTTTCARAAASSLVALGVPVVSAKLLTKIGRDRLGGHAGGATRRRCSGEPRTSRSPRSVRRTSRRPRARLNGVTACQTLWRPLARCPGPSCANARPVIGLAYQTIQICIC
jgi:hypothetical protein